MSLQSDVIQFLIALGTGAGTRVHDEQVPQQAPMPFIATAALGGNTPETLSGTRLFARGQIRVGIFGLTATDRDSVATAVREGFDNWRAANPKGGLLGDTRVISIRLTRSSDEVSLSEGDALIKGAALDLSFMYQE